MTKPSREPPYVILQSDRDYYQFNSDDNRSCSEVMSKVPCIRYTMTSKVSEPIVKPTQDTLFLLLLGKT